MSTLTHLWRHLAMMGPITLGRITAQELLAQAADRIDRIVRLPSPYSIDGVCRRRRIPTIRADDVNAGSVVDWIRGYDPDVVLSSGNQIFGPGLLAVPRLASLNRHTSLLPAYRGVYPVFWCLLNGEREVGVSVHTMTAKIDEGVILAQRRLGVQPGDTFFALVDACFTLGVEAITEALHKVQEGDFTPVDSGRAPSYYSYPTWRDAREFRRRGNRIL